jgi:hypothetical protein
MTPKEYAQTLVDKIMFNTSVTHLDEVKAIAHIVIDEIKLNSLDESSKFLNQSKKEIDKL